MRSVFSRAIVDAALRDPKVLLLTGDHGYALFDEFCNRVPDQFINAGVAEQNMVGVAAGLAKCGFKPIVYGLSAFVPIRVLEQIKLDVCYKHLPVIFIGDGAGLVYSSLGSSHQSTEDIAALRAIPNIQILSPCDAFEMAYALDCAFSFTAPTYIRMGKADLGQVHTAMPTLRPGELVLAKTGMNKYISILSTGSMVNTALAMSIQLNDCDVWSAPWIKPIDEAQVCAIASSCDEIIVIEEHAIAGGFGSLVAEIVSQYGRTRVTRLGVQDRFSQKCGSYAYLVKEHQLDIAALISRLPQRLWQSV